MKKKQVIYVMLPLLVLVWGVVFYQLYSYFFSTPVYAQQKVEEEVNIDEIKRDTFSIVANYRDPFLGKTLRKKVTRSSSSSIKKVPKKLVSKPADKPWPTVAYAGMIKNNNSDRRVGIVKIGGKEYLAKKGDVLNEISILEVDKNSIKVGFQKETKTINK